MAAWEKPAFDHAPEANDRSPPSQDLDARRSDEQGGLEVVVRDNLIGRPQRGTEAGVDQSALTAADQAVRRCVSGSAPKGGASASRA